MGLHSLFTYGFLFLLIANSAQARTCQELYQVKIEAELYQNTNRITHQGVEFFNRNNDIGPQRRGELKFETWTEISYKDTTQGPEYSVVGLTEKGSLYHVMAVGGRKLARKLSGVHKIVGFRMSDQGRLLAWNENGQSLLFSETYWLTPVSRQILGRFMKLWGGTAIGAVTALQALKMVLWEPNMSFDIPIEMLLFQTKLPIPEALMVFASGLSSAFSQLYRFEFLNTNPDGFQKVNVSPTGSAWLSLNLEPLNQKDFQTLPKNMLPVELRSELTEEYSE